MNRVRTFNRIRDSKAPNITKGIGWIVVINAAFMITAAAIAILNQ